MRLVTACFEFSHIDYRRLLRALEASVGQNMPGQLLEVIDHLPEHDYTGHGSLDQSHRENTAKAIVWNDVVQRAADGEEICLIDCDTLVLRDLSPAFADDREFDLALTYRSYRLPINTGVVFLRASAPVREFFDIWTRINLAMLDDEALHQSYRKKKYGGIHQAALGAALEGGCADDLRITALDCDEWNCEWTSWLRFDPRRTRVLHVLGKLRHRALAEPRRNRKGQIKKGRINRMAQIWRDYERRHAA